MYSPIEIENVEYQLKPMNCPFHLDDLQVAAAQLPRPAVALGGAGHGLPLRALGRAARPDARARLHAGRRAHLLPPRPARGRDRCACSTSSTDILRDLRLRPTTTSTSRRGPRRRRGADEQWEAATAALRKALESRELPYQVDAGEGVFYGPKIDIKIKDALGPRLAVLDDPGRLQQPEAVRPRVHRRGRQGAPAGHDPPRAARQPGALLRRADRALRRRLPALAGAGAGGRHPGRRAAPGVRASRSPPTLRDAGLRVEVDDRSEKMGYKIREAQLQKMPYMLVVGDKEVEAGSVSVRHRHAGDLGTMDVADLGSRASSASRPSAPSEEEVPPRPQEVSHRPQDGPHQRPHPRRRRSASSTRTAPSSASCRRSRRCMLAEEKGLDLVEIAATATPPVCRIMNSGKYFYQQAKRDAEARKHQRHIQIKEVKFRPKIDEHDFQFKRKNVGALPRRRATRSSRSVIFRGREIVHSEIGRRILRAAGSRAGRRGR